jgi:hypothetical protein
LLSFILICYHLPGFVSASLVFLKSLVVPSLPYLFVFCHAFLFSKLLTSHSVLKGPPGLDFDYGAPPGSSYQTLSQPDACAAQAWS